MWAILGQILFEEQLRKEAAERDRIAQEQAEARQRAYEVEQRRQIEAARKAAMTAAQEQQRLAEIGTLRVPTLAGAPVYKQYFKIRDYNTADAQKLQAAIKAINGGAWAFAYGNPVRWGYGVYWVYEANAPLMRKAAQSARVEIVDLGKYADPGTITPAPTQPRPQPAPVRPAPVRPAPVQPRPQPQPEPVRPQPAPAAGGSGLLGVALLGIAGYVAYKADLLPI